MIHCDSNNNNNKNISLKMRIFVTMMANGSLDHFKNNSLTKFTNVLPHAIQLQSESKKLHVRLRRIIMPFKLAEEDPAACHIFVHLSELEPKRINNAFDKSLADFKFPPTLHLTDDYALHDFENTPYYELQNVPLVQLSVLITNSKREQLKLAPGPPTIVVLEITDMDHSAQFTITCQSKNRFEKELYPNNSLTKFRVRLPQEFHLKNWEVAMLNMTYPSNVRHVKREKIVYMKLSTNYDPDKSRTLSWDLMDYNNARQFIRAVDTSIEEDDFYGKIISMKKIKKGEERGFYQFWSANYSDHYDDWDDEQHYVQIIFSEGFTKAFGQMERQEVLWFRKGMAVTLHGVPNILPLQSPPSTVGMVYCDVVQPSPVSQILAPLLQIVPIKAKNHNDNVVTRDTKKEELSIYEPQHLIFKPVVEREFSDIEFEILQPDGTPHLFETQNINLNDSTMTFSLLFRRQKIE